MVYVKNDTGNCSSQSVVPNVAVVTDRSVHLEFATEWEASLSNVFGFLLCHPFSCAMLG